MTATLKVHIALFFFIAAMVAMAARLVQLEVQEKDFLQGSRRCENHSNAEDQCPQGHDS